MNETVSFNLVGIAMSGWDEASVDELLADPIVRDLMAADGVDTGELRALLYEVQRTIERYAATRGGPTSSAGFAELYGASPSSTTRADLAGPTLPENRGRSDTRKSRTFLAGRPSLSMAPLGSVVCGEIRCTARS